MNRTKLLLTALFILAIALVGLALSAASAQDTCQVQPDNTQVCIIDGKICIVNPDGSQVCRVDPLAPNSPVGQGSAGTRVYLPLVER
jgi:hypothetical protein